MSQIRIDGTLFNYRLDGREDRPLVVLSHSLATSHEMWGYQLPLLARHFRVLSYDMRGHGASEAVGQELSGGYTLEMLADDVVNLTAKLGFSRFHFVGLSIGGMIGQVLALRHGKVVDRLVLSSTGTGKASPEARAMWDERLNQVRKSGPASLAEGTLLRWFSADFMKRAPHVIEWIDGQIRATPSEGYIGCGTAIKEMNIAAEALGTLRQPTLVIAGEKDPGAPVAGAETLRSRIQGAQLTVIPDAMHLCNIEKAHPFNEALLGFLLAGRTD
jgi:3-oxoadipate enol-lactonase